jgi:hypothetical protein
MNDELKAYLIGFDPDSYPVMTLEEAFAIVAADIKGTALSVDELVKLRGIFAKNEARVSRIAHTDGRSGAGGCR